MEIEKKYRGALKEESEGEFKLSVYEDEKCSREVKNINFGPVRPGEEKNKWFWLKNTGERYLHRIYVGHGVIDSKGWRSMAENYLGGSLDVGEKCMALFQLKVASEVEIGEYSGSIPITVYGDESSI
ncbi:MAG: hypothetical protein KGY66_06595 [Candidatus Thermoplasmatota archaeon]|nr:hypothetical protein [Candidatus Thermoplasmatota archaeon]MBS3790567.1 hypothetical protein [Candidatus Thermoplasmatota archaeon]